MKKGSFFIILLLTSSLLFGQFNETDSLSGPLFPIDKASLLREVHFTLDMRLGFRTHFENGRDDDYSEFRHEVVAFGIGGKVHEKVGFRFRHRFNREAAVQTLDKLDGNVELAFVDISLTDKMHLQLGKMFAYFGGFEYEFNPLEVLEYNDIQSNVLNYVTGAGMTYQVSGNHKLGFQVLNSRTMRYEDIYEGNVPDEIKEPKWPVAVVGNWTGNFFNGKFQTIYSYSHSKIVKNRGTNFITLGHKYREGNFTLMYDLSYSHEQIDTKGIVTEIIGGEKIALNAVYLENWLRAEYRFGSKFTGLLTLMTSGASAKNITGPDSGYSHLRTSYGVIPTVYYRPFEDIDVRFYLSYIGRYYTYSDYVRHELGIPNYNTGEVRFGFIAPLWIF